MTNPDNIVRVRARNGGRASVYEANGWAQGYTSGLLDGAGVVQNTSADMNVLVGGSTSNPDVVLAENPSGYRIALDIVGRQAVAITAPASNSRITAIVAYTDDLSLATTEDNVTGSPSSCGLLAVNGTASASPSEPTDAQIRTAITADGATGSQAAYCIVATIEVANDTTIITNSLITNNVAKLAGTGVVSSQNIDFTTLTGFTLPYVSITQSFGYGTTATLVRIGNVVFCQGSPINNSNAIPSGEITLSETIPSGYRPVASLGTNSDAIVAGVSTTSTNTLGWRIYNSGQIKVISSTSIPKSNRLVATGTWITEDAWPS